MTLSIFTDGACVPNPGDGGWAFVVYRDEVEIHEAHGGRRDTTNNAMELTGMLEAVRWLRGFSERRGIVDIFCDSKYVVDGCNSWRLTWRKNDWKRKHRDSGAPMAIVNEAIWRDIDATLEVAPKLSVRIQWVKGHAGNIGNERADYLTMVGAAEAAGCSIEEIYAREHAAFGHRKNYRTEAKKWIETNHR